MQGTTLPRAAAPTVGVEQIIFFASHELGDESIRLFRHYDRAPLQLWIRDSHSAARHTSKLDSTVDMCDVHIHVHQGNCMYVQANFSLYPISMFGGAFQMTKSKYDPNPRPGGSKCWRWQHWSGQAVAVGSCETLCPRARAGLFFHRRISDGVSMRACVRACVHTAYVRPALGVSL